MRNEADAKNKYAEMIRHIIDKGDSDVVEAIKEINNELSRVKLENERLLLELNEIKNPTTIAS